MKIILKDAILDSVTLKIIWGYDRLSLNSQCCGERATVTPEGREENTDVEKRLDWSHKKEELERWCWGCFATFRSAVWSMGELLKTTFFCPLKHIMHPVCETDVIMLGKAHPVPASIIPKGYWNTGGFKEKPQEWQ